MRICRPHPSGPKFRSFVANQILIIGRRLTFLFTGAFAVVFLFGLPPVCAGETFRIATFNINYGNVNLNDIVRTIRKANADVICLQETTNAFRNDSETRLKREFLKTHPYIYFVGHNGRYAAERFGFVSKYPLADKRFVPPVHGLFGTCFATVILPDGNVRLANVHLSPFQVARGSNAVRAFKAISAVESRHKLEIEAIARNVNAKVPTIVCGDFNSLSTFVAPRTLSGLGLQDSFASVTETADSHPTWRWPIKGMPVQFRIDYIFHSSHFETAKSEVLPTVGSDHSLLVSEMKLIP